MLPLIITKLVGWAVALFYDLERTGPTWPLAKAPLFEQALVGAVLRGLGGLPVYRKQNEPELMHLNERTFGAAIEALQAAVRCRSNLRDTAIPSLPWRHCARVRPASRYWPRPEGTGSSVCACSPSGPRIAGSMSSAVAPSRRSANRSRSLRCARGTSGMSAGPYATSPRPSRRGWSGSR
ncbi:MAG: hypothetical protein FJ207_14540 [Gemmatimonadetes bacterium]|nr:hypothetical protein [Gemmatimonadota bacterium]